MAYSIESTSDHCYEGTTCLINKLDIRDEHRLAEAEAAIVLGKLTALKQRPVQGTFNFEHYKQIHRFLFCDLYDWAGQIRDIDISKKEPHLLLQIKSKPVPSPALRDCNHFVPRV